ncbi:MAG: hypothetical protein A2172_00485 [Candidatus Woykebacteria bacterium RBG_13_40_15]|uniref:Uncharacterized protein n=1 Tax=Candidatus Woykebacteria bacterium RBG_13_40_15 TaxID=1802593 RepID=A0A1G1WAH6_9BACT|nr:MAG: hypothetical protein A2172_00485 [Candidatus Woykebacteria bacterium RBG_13_40_15]
MEKDLYFNWHKYYREHLLQYLLVVIVFVFSLFLLLQLKDFLYKSLVVGFLSIFYLTFGIWHHWEEKNLRLGHVLEYLIVSTIIFVVLYSVFLS